MCSSDLGSVMRLYELSEGLFEAGGSLPRWLTHMANKTVLAAGRRVPQQ